MSFSRLLMVCRAPQHSQCRWLVCAERLGDALLRAAHDLRGLPQLPNALKCCKLSQRSCKKYLTKCSADVSYLGYAHMFKIAQTGAEHFTSQSINSQLNAAACPAELLQKDGLALLPSKAQVSVCRLTC